MAVAHDSAAAPPKARPRPGLEFDLPESEAFLRLPPEERRRRLDEVSRVFQAVFRGVTVDDLIAEKRREAARED